MPPPQQHFKQISQTLFFYLLLLCDPNSTVTLVFVEISDIYVTFIHQIQPWKKWYIPLSPIEIGLLWAKITYLKSQIIAWIRGCKDIRGQSWRWKKISADLADPGRISSNQAEWADILFRPPYLTPDIFAAPAPKSMFSTSFKRSIANLFGN